MSLRTGAIKGCKGSHENTKYSREVPQQTCELEPTSTRTQKELQWIYLANQIPTKPDSYKGWEGLGTKLAKYATKVAIPNH